MTGRTSRILIALTLIAAVPTWSLAQRGAKAKRVAPPKFDEAKTKEYFFADVFAILQGPRPNLAAVAPRGGNNGGAPSAGANGGGDTSVAGWQAVISAEAIEDEIKLVKTAFDANVTTPGDFKGRGYKECRRDLTMLAMLFGIIHEYDGEVRFKQKNASGLRDVFARTAGNCKVGTTQVYNEAKLRKSDLQDVVGGGTYAGKEGDPDMTWDKLCDRSPLMQRLEVAQQGKLQPATSSAAQFKKDKDLALREAQLVAAIAVVLMKEEMEDAGSEDYDEFCVEMKSASADIVTAVKQDNYEAARTAVGRIGQACTRCHENYRG